MLRAFRGGIGLAVISIMKIKTAVFEKSAPNLATSPVWGCREFAFIGRSNVGKSSLLNLLTEQKDLAKVSATPGKTRMINFFKINNAWSLVDLPGYGFAKVAQHKRSDFNQAVARYLEKRDNLACVFVLIDSRLPPQQIDLDFIQWLEGTERPFALIFTKTDKQSPTQTRAKISLFTEALAEWRTEPPPILTSSSKTKSGRREILEFIAGMLAS